MGRETRFLWIERFLRLEKMRPTTGLSRLCAIVGGFVTVIAREVSAARGAVRSSRCGLGGRRAEAPAAAGGINKNGTTLAAPGGKFQRTTNADLRHESPVYNP